MLNYYVALVGTFAQRLGRGDRGATAVEYGLIVALIAIVIVAAVILLGQNLSTLFNTVANDVNP